jgi:hypothetical protein
MRETREELGPGDAVLLVGAAFAVGIAIVLRQGRYHPVGLVLIAASLLACGVVVLGRSPRHPTFTEGRVSLALLAVAATQVALLSVMPVAQSLRTDRLGNAPLYLVLGVAMAALAAIARGGRRFGAWSVPALLLSHFAAGLWVLSHAPPATDMYMFQRGAIDALSAGLHPYGILYPNPYPHDRYYGPGLAVDGVLQFGYPYPPLSLMCTLLAAPFGDIRYAHLLALTTAGALVAYVRPGPSAPLASGVMLFSPAFGMVLQRGAIEPFVLLCLTGVVFSAIRAPRALVFATGLLLASKQYVVLVVPALRLLFAGSWRRAWFSLVGRAFLVALAIVVPWAAGEPSGFVKSVIVLQFLQPFRIDALSFPALFALPMTLSLSLGALVLAVWRAPRSPAGFAAALAFVYLVFFSFNKQAFVNYYYFVVGTLALALAARRRS